ncbi:MAG: Tn3 family transposase, partial [Solirubrobacteraceae bacterium]
MIAAEQLLTHRIQVELILEQWDELLRIAGSIKRGWIHPERPDLPAGERPQARPHRQSATR